MKLDRCKANDKCTLNKANNVMKEIWHFVRRRYQHALVCKRTSNIYAISKQF